MVNFWRDEKILSPQYFYWGGDPPRLLGSMPLATHIDVLPLVLLLVAGASLFKKAYGSVVSNVIGMKFDSNVFFK